MFFLHKFFFLWFLNWNFNNYYSVPVLPINKVNSSFISNCCTWLNTLSISGLGLSGSGWGSGVSCSSTNLLGNCSFNRLRILLFCFSYSALISACILSFSLPSFRKLPNFVKYPFNNTFSSEIGCNAKWQWASQFSFFILCPHYSHNWLPFALSSLLAWLYSFWFSCSISFCVSACITCLKPVKLFNILWCTARFTHSLLHLTILQRLVFSHSS